MGISRKTTVMGVLGAVVIGVAAYGSGILADQVGRGGFGRNYTPERHEQMQKAFAEKDYSAWKSLMGERGAGRVITEQNFARFSEMHQLMLDGKVAEANKIRAELGLGQGAGRGGRGMMNGERGQNRGGNFIDQDGNGACDHLQ